MLFALVLATSTPALADTISLDTGATIEGDLARYEFGGDCQVSVGEGPLTGAILIVPCHRVTSFVRTQVRTPVAIGEAPAQAVASVAPARPDVVPPSDAATPAASADSATTNVADVGDAARAAVESPAPPPRATLDDGVIPFASLPQAAQDAVRGGLGQPDVEAADHGPESLTAESVDAPDEAAPIRTPLYPDDPIFPEEWQDPTTAEAAPAAALGREPEAPRFSVQPRSAPRMDDPPPQRTDDPSDDRDANDPPIPHAVAF